MLVRNTTLEVVRGSVLDQDVDAIVNAANTMMRGGGGIDGAIHMAAGPKLLEELRRIAPKGCEIGQVVVTSGHQLKQRWILHTPGPIWRGGDADEEGLLALCYLNCMKAALALNAGGIAFCSISTGSFGFPLERAARIAASTTYRFLASEDTGLKRVVLAMFGSKEYEAFTQALLDLHLEA